MGVNDNLLIKEIKKGNKTVFEEVYKKYYSKLVTFAQGYLFDFETSKDVVQKLFVQLWLNREVINIHSSIKSYLFSCTRNSCLNKIRDLKIRDKNKLMFIEATLNTTPPSKSNYKEYLKDEVWREIQKLPPQIKQIIIMKYFNGLKRSEIAAELSISENTVKTQLSRGRAKLSTALKDKMGFLLIISGLIY